MISRRDVVAMLSAAATSAVFCAAARAAPRLKITDVRLVPLKVLRETGQMTAAWDPEVSRPYRIGGGSYLEIVTDQGLTGIGPNMDAAGLAAAKPRLLGRDPFDVEALAGPLRYYVPGRGVASLEIALWDLVGKALGTPVYRIWGAHKHKVRAYASMVQLSTPEERARMGVKLKSEGWGAMKLRLHYETMREDIAMVAAVRKAVGDDFVLMTDANQAQSATGFQPGVRWDYRRALETARELERLGVYFLEEPLHRYDWEGLANLNREVGIIIAGGENNVGLREFRQMLEQQVFDLIQPDVMVADGVTGMREIAALARAFGRPLIPHHGGGNLGTIMQLHAIATWSNCDWIELLHDPPVAAYTVGFGIMENPPLVDKEGYLPVPQGPGLGVTINPAMLG